MALVTGHMDFKGARNLKPAEDQLKLAHRTVSFAEELRSLIATCRELCRTGQYGLSPLGDTCCTGCDRLCDIACGWWYQ